VVLGKIDLMIFDIDDTLMESEHINIKIIKAYFRRKFGIALDKDDIEYIYGHSWETIYSRYVKKYHLEVSPLEIQEEILFYKGKYLRKNPPKLATGVLEILSTPKRKCVVTGNGKEEAVLMLESCGLVHYFDAVFSADDYLESKPSPAGFLMAMNYFKVEPERTIVFEDSRSGIIAAKRANALACFVKEFAREDCSSLADYSFENFKDAKAFLFGTEGRTF